MHEGQIVKQVQSKTRRGCLFRRLIDEVGFGECFSSYVLPDGLTFVATKVTKVACGENSRPTPVRARKPPHTLPHRTKFTFCNVPLSANINLTFLSTSQGGVHPLPPKSLPCARGGGFCKAKLGGAVVLIGKI